MRCYRRSVVLAMLTNGGAPWHTASQISFRGRSSPISANGLQANGHRPSYRPDIDGLRTIAVLPVVLFHFGIPPFSGGFVGVDIFFVISGYLITGILAAELAAGTFSIAGFYERRIKRIIPALMVMIAVTALIALFILTPAALGRFASEVWWSSFFSTNMLFFRKDGYFDGTSNMRLLLHTWSLSVEEQYYILIPLLLLAGWRRFRSRLVAVLLGLALVSFAVAAACVALAPSAAFYLLSSRAWELLCGSLLAVASPRVRLPQWGREAVAAAGAGAIAIAILAYDSATPFPGAAALLPCLGATVLLWAGERGHTTVVGRFLQWSPMVAIGRLSYSLYLWHWPVLVLAKYYLLRELTTGESVMLIGVSLLAAIVSFVAVEQPFRRKGAVQRRRALFVATACILIAMNVFGSKGKAGFPGRLDAEAVRLAAFSGSRDPEHDRCMTLSAAQIRNGEACEYGRRHAGSPEFAVWGDSHSGALMPAFRALAEERGWWGLQLGFPGCPPLMGVTVIRADAVEGRHCAAVNDAIIEQISKLGIRTVILVARWQIYADSWQRVGSDARNKSIYITDAEAPVPAAEVRRAVFQRGWERTLTRLQQLGVRVLALEPIPETSIDIPAALALNRMRGGESRALEPERERVAVRQAWVQERLAEAERAGRLSVVRTHDVLCDANRCAVERGGVPIYRDVDHLSVPGALLLKPSLEKALAP